MKYNKRIAEIMGITTKESEKRVAAYEKELMRYYKESLDEVRYKLAMFFEKYGGKELTYYEANLYNRLHNLEQEIAEQLKVLAGRNKQVITKSIKDVYSDNYYSTGYAVESTIGRKMGFGVLSKKAVDGAVLNNYGYINWYDSNKELIQKLNKQVRESISQGIIQGKGYAHIAREAKTKFEKGFSGAKRIMWTESHRAMSAGRVDAFDQAENAAQKLNIETDRMWVATLDKRTRDTHADADGQLADKNGLFNVGGEKLRGPGLGVLPENNIHCRCTTILQFKELPQKFRQDGDYITYDEWKEKKRIN